MPLYLVYSFICLCFSGGNVICIHLWDRDSGPYMQALHFSFGLGAFVSPLLAEPFLGHDLPNSTYLFNGSYDLAAGKGVGGASRRNLDV